VAAVAVAVVEAVLGAVVFPAAAVLVAAPALRISAVVVEAAFPSDQIFQAVLAAETRVATIPAKQAAEVLLPKPQELVAAD
jgi:hypothetical protein